MRAYILSEVEQTVQIGLTIYIKGIKHKELKQGHYAKSIKALRAYKVDKNNSKIAEQVLQKYIKEAEPNKLYSSIKRTVKFTH